MLAKTHHRAVVSLRPFSWAEHVCGQLSSQLDLVFDGAILVQVPVECVLVVHPARTGLWKYQTHAEGGCAQIGSLHWQWEVVQAEMLPSCPWYAADNSKGKGNIRFGDNVHNATRATGNDADLVSAWHV